MTDEWIQSFKEKLDQVHAWPTLYTFKFIVPKGKEVEVVSIFPKHQPALKPSKNGNYTSVTFQMMMPSSEAVVAIYRSVSGIEGIIAL